MAEMLDVAARLAEGSPAVDNIGDYVWACHLLGYQNPDLTLHAAQVRDWYSSEDGLDLRALDADRAALDAAASATDSARQLQEQQLGALGGAWQGRGGGASHEFLLRHGEASAAAAAAVRDAVDALTALRDDLWRTVDEKVATAVAIDDRHHAERPEWLAATQTVSAGMGDRAVASELIDQRVKPFVDNDIRSDWLTAMQKAMAAVAAAFDTATAALTAEPSAMFEVPGDLGPSSTPSVNRPPAADAASTAPAAWPSPAPAAAPAVSPMAAATPAFPASPEPIAAPMPAAPMPAAAMPATAPAGSATPAMPTMPTMPSPGDLGGGLTGAAGGLAGLGRQLADAFGGLINRPDDALQDPSELKEEPKGDDPLPDDEEPVSDDEDPEDETDTETAETDEAETEEAASDGADTEEAVREEAACGERPSDLSTPPDPAPTPPPPPVPTPQEPVADPPPPPAVEEPPHAAPASTPCEIAADELPQVGP